ncbi:MAG: SPOR domain-containing protein [Ginsengibacter sp.]
MKLLFFLLFVTFSFCSFSQVADSVIENKVIIHADHRLAILARKESELNTAILKSQARTAKGYRLMVLNTNDRDYALRVRTELLQKFPEQKPYMWFSNPYIKLKFGNFRTREEAEEYKKLISKMLDGASIYLLTETIEVKPDKDFNPDEFR